MPLIKTIIDNDLGKFDIKFSTVNYKFYVECKLPTHYSNDKTFNTYDEVLIYINQIKNALLYESKFLRKTIFLKFESSETDINIDDKWNSRVLYNYVGFTLDWYVLDEFSSYNGEKLYKITEVYSNNKKDLNTINSLNNLRLGSGRLLEYDENLYNFLIETSTKLKNIVHNLYKFIDNEQQILMNNITNNQLKINENNHE